MADKRDKRDERDYQRELAELVKNDSKERRQLFFLFLKFVLMIVTVLAVIGVGAVLFVSIRNYYLLQSQTDGYYAHAAGIDRDMENKLDELNDRFAAERLKLFFSQDEVYSFSYNMWKYELLVNGQPVDKETTKLTIKEGDKISIRETLRDTLLPADFINIGNLVRNDKNDAVKNHFVLSGITYYLEEKKEGFTTEYTVAGLEFTKGTSFDIMLSVQLQDRLGFVEYLIPVTVS